MVNISNAAVFLSFNVSKPNLKDAVVQMTDNMMDMYVA